MTVELHVTSVKTKNLKQEKISLSDNLWLLWSLSKPFMNKIIRYQIIPALLAFTTSSNAAALRHLTPFHVPDVRHAGTRLWSSPAVWCWAAKITRSSEAQSTNFPKTESMALSIPPLHSFHLHVPPLLVLSCYYEWLMRLYFLPLMCTFSWSVNIIFLGLLPTAHFTPGCSVQGENGKANSNQTRKKRDRTGFWKCFSLVQNRTVLVRWWWWW